MEANGAAVVINKETGVISSAGSFSGEAGRKYSSVIEAYDNEGRDPSNSNFLPILVSDREWNVCLITLPLVLCVWLSG